MSRTRLTDRIARTTSITERLDIIASELEQVDPRSALIIDQVSDRLECKYSSSYSLQEKDLEKKPDGTYYNPLKRILNKFPEIKGKFIPSRTGWNSTPFKDVNIKDTISFKFDKDDQKSGEKEIFTIGPQHFRITSEGSSEGKDLTESELVAELKKRFSKS
jgi:hypothetical protein